MRIAFFAPRTQVAIPQQKPAAATIAKQIEEELNDDVFSYSSNNSDTDDTSFDGDLSLEIDANGAIVTSPDSPSNTNALKKLFMSPLEPEVDF